MNYFYFWPRFYLSWTFPLRLSIYRPFKYEVKIRRSEVWTKTIRESAVGQERCDIRITSLILSLSFHNVPLTMNIGISFLESVPEMNPSSGRLNSGDFSKYQVKKSRRQERPYPSLLSSLIFHGLLSIFLHLQISILKSFFKFDFPLFFSF